MNEYMTTPVIINRAKQSDKYGKVSDFVSISATCRIQLKDNMIKDETGRDILSLGVIYTAIELKPNDRVTHNNKTYTITKTSVATDLFNTNQYHKGYLV